MHTVATLWGIEDLPRIDLDPEDLDRLPTSLAAAAVTHGPIFTTPANPDMWGDDPAGPPLIVFMVGPEANQFILHTHRHHFSHDLGWTPFVGPLIGKGLLNMDGEAHARDRKLMNPAFTVAYMARYLPIMQRVIATRTADWAARGAVDLHDEMRKIAFDVAAEALVGMPTGPQVDHLRDLFYDLFHGFDVARETWEEYALRMLMTQRELNMTLLNEIAHRRQSPTDDILGFMVQARAEDGRELSDEQLLGHVNILLVAGHETTTTLSAWLLYDLARHPETLAEVRAEMDVALGDGATLSLEGLRGLKALGWTIDETGRFHAPVRNAPRGVVKDFEFAGYTIPAGSQVRYSIGATHRLPSLWREPDRWDPQRFAPPREEQRQHPFAFLPFGAGPRICIGLHFAQVEVKAMAAHILRAYDLTPLDAQPPAEIGFITTVPDRPMRVRVTPHLAG